MGLLGHTVYIFDMFDIHIFLNGVPDVSILSPACTPAVPHQPVVASTQCYRSRSSYEKWVGYGSEKNAMSDPKIQT